MKKVYVLTREHNEYDQHGEYFEAVFEKKPSLEVLAKWMKENDGYSLPGDIFAAVAFLEHLRNGGGRVDKEDIWYNLELVEVH